MIRTSGAVVLAVLALFVIACGSSRANRAAAAPTADSPIANPTPVGGTGEWRLVFADEFSDDTLNEGHWATCYWWSSGGCTIASNEELEWYQPQNVRVSDGVLKLQAREEEVTSPDGEHYDYTSGMVTTGRSSSDRTRAPRFAFLYGYAEIRAKVPKGKGLWPAFWMVPATHRSRPEIDVLEILGHEPNKQYMYFHYLDEEGVRKRFGTSWTGPDFSADWHTFAVEWRPDAVIWYVDGVERQRLEDASIIPQTPMYLILNLAVGGEWPGAPDDETLFPSDYEIDYVRVWSQHALHDLFASTSTYVDGSEPEKNFGTSAYLIADGEPKKVAYLKFDTSGLKGQTIKTAALRIWTIDEPGSDSTSTQTVRLVEDSDWDANQMTFEDRPSTSSEVLGTLSLADVNQYYDIPLDTAALQPYIGDVLSLAIDSSGEDGLYFYSSRHFAKRVHLLITTDISELPQVALMLPRIHSAPFTAHSNNNE